MVFYPILGRELKKAARQPLLYRLRTGAVVAGVALGVFLLWGSDLWQTGAAVGREIFQITIWAAFILCLLSGVVLTSTLLCEERREGSLALLFLTRLKGIDVLLGKLAAIGLLSGQIVLGLFPLLALCIALGGVSLAEFWRAVQLLLVTLLFSLSMGLFVSALNKNISRAVFLTFAAIMLNTALVTGADWFARSELERWGGNVGAIVPGLLPAMTCLLDPYYALPPQSFELCLLYQTLMSVALLVLGGLMLKRLSISERTVKPIRLFRPIGTQSPPTVRNPILWLALRHRWRWINTWLVFCLLILVWIGILHIFDFSQQMRLLAVFGLAPVLHLLLKIAIAAEAVERLGSARKGELELLLVTPIKGGQVLHGHYNGLLRQFAFPVATLILIDLIFIFFYEPPPGRSTRDSVVGYLFIYTLAISLLVDLPALIWRGLWDGLRSENAVQALRRTLLGVVVLPVPFCIVTFAVPALFLTVGNELFSWAGWAISDVSGWVTGLIVWWWLVAFIANALLQQKAKYQLKTWLRYIASDPDNSRARLNRPRRPGQTMPVLPNVDYALAR